jgi:hypothetical protein
MYRISGSDEQDPIVVETLKAIMSAIRLSEPGRYVIHEINNEPRTISDTVRHWGIGVRWADGTVEIEPEPWHE